MIRLFMSGAGSSQSSTASGNTSHASIDNTIRLSLKRSAGQRRSGVKDFKRRSGSFCGNLSHTTPKTVPAAQLEKSRSFVTRILDSSTDRAANSPLTVDLGLRTTSSRFFRTKSYNSLRTFSSIRNRGCSDFEEDISLAPGQVRGVGQGGLDVACGEGWKGLSDILDRTARFQHLQNLPDHDAGTRKRGFAVAYFGIRHDVSVDFNASHGNSITRRTGFFNRLTGADFFPPKWRGQVGGTEFRISTFDGKCAISLANP